jgi:hypothetical protein
MQKRRPVVSRLAILQRMAGAAERAVQIEAFRTDGECFQTLH